MPVIPYLGLFALMVILAAAARWFWRAWQVDIPKNSSVFRGLWVVGLVLGGLALYQTPADPFAAWAVGLGLLLVYLVSTGAQKVSGEMINVGDALPAFTALDEDGHSFDSSSLTGKPVLLKFFRGHW